MAKIEDLIDKLQKVNLEKPIVFISYATEELACFSLCFEGQK